MRWLAIGPAENWKRALELGVWGITDRYSFFWNQVAVGDSLFFYVTSPVKGVVGYGTVVDKRRDAKPLWRLEVEEGRALWPLRLRFETSLALADDRWEMERVRLTSQQAVLQKGFQAVREDVGELVREQLATAAGT